MWRSTKDGRGLVCVRGFAIERERLAAELAELTRERDRIANDLARAALDAAASVAAKAQAA